MNKQRIGAVSAEDGLEIQLVLFSHTMFLTANCLLMNCSSRDHGYDRMTVQKWLYLELAQVTPPLFKVWRTHDDSKEVVTEGVTMAYWLCPHSCLPCKKQTQACKGVFSVHWDHSNKQLYSTWLIQYSLATAIGNTNLVKTKRACKCWVGCLSYFLGVSFHASKGLRIVLILTAQITI